MACHVPPPYHAERLVLRSWVRSVRWGQRRRPPRTGHAHQCTPALLASFQCWCSLMHQHSCDAFQQHVLCPGHVVSFEPPAAGAASKVLRASSNTAIRHEILVAAPLPIGATQGQLYNSHICSSAPCRSALAPRTRHRKCSDYHQQATHSQSAEMRSIARPDNVPEYYQLILPCTTSIHAVTVPRNLNPIKFDP